MIINDRFTRGWVAGTCAGIFGGILDFLPYYIGISKLRLSDWSAILIFGRTPPFSLADQVYGVMVLAGGMGVIGIVFTFLLPMISEKNIYFKGWIVFLVPWWIIYLLTALAETKGTLNLSVMTTLTNGIAISIIGITTAFIYRLLEPK